jgi:antitoxin VapB
MQAATHAMPTLKPITPSPSEPRHARLFRNGANQAIRIPREFELAGSQASIRQVGNALLIEPLVPQHPQGSLAAMLAALGQIEATNDATIPDLDAGLLPLNDVVLSAP